MYGLRFCFSFLCAHLSGIFLSSPPSMIYLLHGSPTPLKITLHFFLKLLLRSETICLPSKNKLFPNPSLCLAECFNFLSASGHALSFSCELFYLTVATTHHECIPMWQNQMCTSTMLQINKYHGTCIISLCVCVSA
jgi:hypothetical protein